MRKWGWLAFLMYLSIPFAFCETAGVTAQLEALKKKAQKNNINTIVALVNKTKILCENENVQPETLKQVEETLVELQQLDLTSPRDYVTCTGKISSLQSYLNDDLLAAQFVQEAADRLKICNTNNNCRKKMLTQIATDIVFQHTYREDRAQLQCVKAFLGTIPKSICIMNASTDTCMNKATALLSKSTEELYDMGIALDETKKENDHFSAPIEQMVVLLENTNFKQKADLKRLSKELSTYLKENHKKTALRVNYCFERLQRGWIQAFNTELPNYFLKLMGEEVEETEETDILDLEGETDDDESTL